MISVLDLPDILSWDQDGAAAAQVRDNFLGRIGDRMGQLLGRLAAETPLLADALKAALSAATDEAFARVATAPEVTWRLLWPEMTGDLEAARFITAALACETMASNGEPRTRPLWTALGDRCIGAEAPVPPIEGWDLCPIDLGSPHRARVDVSGHSDITPRSGGDFTKEEWSLVAERLLAADAILRTVPQIRAFVRAFTFVLVVMKDDGAPDVFASGSTGQFIGRSFLSNPHLAAVSVGEIVESLVHEAIHSLLYMLERDTRWINDPALYDPTPLLASPWTGTRLALRPFLQATFVWYGLINLWSRLPPDSVPPDLLRRRLGQALGGFRAGPLLDHAAPWRTAINPVLAGAVEAAQQRVVLALQEEAPA